MTSPTGQKARAFSLIELLTVVSIIGLLTAVSMPSFLSSRSATDLTRNGNLVADCASLGREFALSRNAITALLVAKAESSEELMLTVVELDRETNAWKQIASWCRLPDIIAIEDNAEKPHREAAKDLAEWRAIAPGGQPLELETSLIFYPDGHMNRGSGNSLTTRKLTVFLKNGGPSTNYYAIEFNQDTSSSRILRPL